MTWFAFKGYNDGQAVDVAGSQEKGLVALGFHGFGTQAQAQATPNSVNILNKLFVNEIIADFKVAVKAGEQPGGPNATPTPAHIVAGDESLAENSIPGVQQIGSFFAGLTESATWIRVAKVLIGGVLVAVGFARITGAGKAAASIAKVVK